MHPSKRNAIDLPKHQREKRLRIPALTRLLSLLFAASITFAFLAKLPSSASELVNPEPELELETNQRLFKSVAIFNVNRTSQHELPILISFASRFVAQKPTATTREIQFAVNEVWNAYRDLQESSIGRYDLSKQTPASVAHSMSNVIKGTGVPLLGEVLDEYVNWSYKLGNYYLSPNEQLTAQAHLFSNFQVSSLYQGKIFSEALELSSTNPELSRAFGILFSRALGAQLNDSADTIKINNPDFANFLTKNTILNELLQSKELTKSQQLETLTHIQTKLHEQTNTIATDLVRSEAKVNDLSKFVEKYIDESEKKSEAVADARKLAEQNALELEGLRATSYVLSSLVGLSNPKVGRELGAILDTGINLSVAINQLQYNWTTDASAFAVNAIFAADILTIGMGLVSAFSGGGQSGDAMILEAVQILSKQLEDFRMEMHGRLDIVDEKLNFLLFETERQFRSLKSDLADLSYLSNHTLGQLQVLLVAMQFSTKAQAELFREKVELEQAIEQGICFRFREDELSPKIAHERFHGCLKTFKASALTVPALTGFDPSSHIRFDQYSKAWAYSPRVAPIERIESELRHFRVNGREGETSETFSGPPYQGYSVEAFFAILPSYLATVRAWPEHQESLDQRAFDEFLSTITRIEETRARVAAGPGGWSLTGLVQEYSNILRQLDKDVNDLVSGIADQQLRGYGEHHYQMFLSSGDSRNSNRERLEEDFMLMPSCNEGDYLKMREPSGMSKADIKAIRLTDPLQLELEDIGTPREIIDILVKLDE